MGLTKSKYCQGTLCRKNLWLNEFKSDLLLGQEIDDSKIKTGMLVGAEAVNYFDSTVSTEVIFEFDGDMCRVDILSEEDGYIDIYEVKSSTGIKDTYFQDVAYQYYIIKNSGANIRSINLMYLNNQYTRVGDLDYKKLFNVEDLTEIAISMEHEVEMGLKEYKQVLLK